MPDSALSPALEAQIKTLLDYYVSQQPPEWVTYAGLVAIVISVLAVWTTHHQTRTTARHHIRIEWNGIADICIQRPQFINVNFTSDYLNHDPDVRFVYEAFCYKTWSLVEYIVERGLEDQNPYNTIIQWVVAYHRAWLENNPYMFSRKNFWSAYEKTRNEPLTLMRNKVLPRLGSKPVRSDSDRYTDSVDWDAVSEEYHKWIIGPWSPRMVQEDPKKGGTTRNHMLTRLRSYHSDDLKQMRILDIGCGPGSMLPSLAGHVPRIFGLDISERALEIASQKAADLKIEFIKVHADMCTYVADEKFDLIISTNSILPTQRADVLRILHRVSENLAPNGRFLAILPSFDTCEELVKYWEEAYRRKSHNEAYVKKCIAAFEAAMKMDRTAYRFADDGVHIQSFHTPETIDEEFAHAGLRITGRPQKIEYPWEYARDFDYGYFPDKPEIWDWYVEAEKGPTKGPIIRKLQLRP